MAADRFAAAAAEYSAATDWLSTLLYAAHRYSRSVARGSQQLAVCRRERVDYKPTDDVPANRCVRRGGRGRSSRARYNSQSARRHGRATTGGVCSIATDLSQPTTGD